MTKQEKLLLKILTGQHDKNITFNDLRTLLQRPGFSERVKGDHYIFTKEEVTEIINIQPKNKMAKAYQVKQVRELITKHKLGGINE